jgi:hypothetical protein
MVLPLLKKYLSTRKIKGKFAIGYRYFLAFAQTHCSIVSLPEHTALSKPENPHTFFKTGYLK